eukprot:TRINITY_DN1466_c0_g1_i14.p1 TRINITY_DN1466_c0_g1~~TRINITY_DN1466_c0_g1_i14.p1  ORF type:complete len:120 (+),score=36.84 TRINITY_DN1466_c0_g1_i14:112-471(+)
MLRSLVGSEMCIRDRYQRRVRDTLTNNMDFVDPVSIAVGIGVGLLLSMLISSSGKSHVNPGIDKAAPKVATMVKAQEIEGEKAVYCRCWRSKTFPLCDGSHNAYNKETGDNVGPLIVSK